MAESKRKAKPSRPAGPASKPARKTAPQGGQDTDLLLPDILGGTEPEDREQVLKRLIKGLKKV